MIDYPKAREILVENLIAKGIRDQRVLDTISGIDREKFVSPSLRTRAYEDTPLPIGDGQTISQPFMVAFMTQLLQLKGDERILEIGTGSGYQTVILAHLAREVFTVERVQSLADTAAERFRSTNYSNIFQHVGDGTLGWEKHAPYDRIIVTAAAPDLPPKLIDQLTKNGIMIIPSGGRSIQELKRVKKRNGTISVSNEGGCIFVPLIGSDGWT